MIGPQEADPLVTTEWLAQNISMPDVRVADASWYLPDAKRDGRAEWGERRIPGAVFFDLEEIADKETGLPHMLPDPAKFSSRVRKLGLGDGARIIVYDGAGLFSAARAWWMFRVMGYRDVFVLDGGFPKWLTEGRAVDDLPPSAPTARHFTARKHAMLVRDAAQIQNNLKTGAEQIVDARSPGRYRGDEPEPRPGMRAGHVPGSLNVHYRSLLNDDGTMKTASDLQGIFERAGLDWAQPVVTMCGSGVTAAILALALTRVGHPSVSLYDGSWAEWGMREDLPVETGTAASGAA